MQRQHVARRRLRDDRGYAMAALLVGMAIMAVFMTAALPVWTTAAKRAREDELVFRGEQYARAIALYQRKFANALPPSIDLLVNERFLRKKYLDPVTGQEFQVLTGSTGSGVPGAGAQGRGGAAGTATGAGARGSTGAQTGVAGQPSGQAGRGGFAGGTTGAPGTGSPFGASGGIVGVASKSTEKSLRMYNGRTAYNEWTFVAQQRQTQAGGQGADAPGLPGRGGANGQGGRGNQAPGGGGFGGRQGNRPQENPFGGQGFRPTGAQGR